MHLMTDSYNVSFEDAALRAAQIGCDLSLGGVMAFFSWPSRGRFDDYSADEASIEASEPYIVEFLLKLITHSGATRVHIIAHSMGNRGLLRAMNNIASDLKSQNKIFGQIVLAAADVDSGTFKNLSGSYVTSSERTTLYVSARDRAVEASRWLHGYARAGLTPPVMIIPGINTVHVAKSDLTLIGHGYVGEARPVLQDIHDLILWNAPPRDRFGLRSRINELGETFWAMGE
jgi:esterase/lipase superfamily enzyme